MVVDIVLPAVLGLVLIGESRIEAGGDKFERLGHELVFIVRHFDEC